MNNQEFETYYKNNFGYFRNCIFNITKDKQLSEDIVQDTFEKLWLKKDDIRTNANNLCLTISKNLAYNHIKHLNIEKDYKPYINYSIDHQYCLEQKEFKKIIENHYQN